MIETLACAFLPLMIGLALLTMAQQRWGRAGRAACLLIFILVLYGGIAAFTYNGVRSVGQGCNLPDDDPYYDAWGLTESLTWPVMFLTGHNLPPRPC